MKNEKNVSVQRLHELFIYDPLSGNFTWKIDQPPKRSKRTNAKGMRAFIYKEMKGYLSGSVDGIRIKAHRAAWAMTFGVWPNGQIDHINQNKGDNRISNLRVVSNKQNCRNQRRPSSNTSKWIGVSLNKTTGKWVAKYKKNYIDYHVGTFNCPTSAAIAVIKARSNAGFDSLHGKQ